MTKPKMSIVDQSKARRQVISVALKELDCPLTEEDFIFVIVMKHEGHGYSLGNSVVVLQ